MFSNAFGTAGVFKLGMRRLLFSTWTVVLALVAGSPAFAGQAALAWDASPDPTVTGYFVYYGTSSQGYSSRIDAGNLTSITVPNLTSGQTYYFAATAYNAALVESAYSNEASTAIVGTVAVVSGAAQTARVSTAFANALTVRVTNSAGVPQPSVTVSWSSPTAGASARLSAATSVTDVNGLAKINATANGISGSYAITAQTSAGSASFALTNVINPSVGNVCTGNLAVSDLVEQYYQAILHRPSDATGKAYWIGEATRLCALGVDVRQTFLVLANFFYNSAEYAAFKNTNSAFVTDNYIAEFGRLPDSGGLSYWTGQIASGLPRNIVLNSFLFAPEFSGYTQKLFGTSGARAEVAVVVNLYGGILGRLPDSGGFTTWVGRLRTAQCQGTAAVSLAVGDLSGQMIASSEYAGRNRSNSQFVQDLYYAFLQRGGDLAGFNNWVGQLNAGLLSREQARQQFLGSPEMQNSIALVAAQGCLP
jgi:hypothetical protein